MLKHILVADHIYLDCESTDFRKAVDGLVDIVSQQFNLDLFSKSIFLFCNRKKDRLISPQQLRWLLEGVSIDQIKVLQK